MNPSRAFWLATRPGGIFAALLVSMALLLTGCKKTGAESLADGKKYIEKKDFARASIELRNAVRLMPKDPEAVYQLGLAFLGSGDVQNAVYAFRAAAELNPKHVESQLRLAELMSLNNNDQVLQEAEKRAKAALAAEANNVDAITTLAYTELRLGKSESAEARLKEILERSPANLKAAVVMANLKMQQKDTAGARAAMKQAIEKNPKVPEAWLAMARFELASGNFKEAEVSLKKVLELDKENVMALQDLAGIFARDQRKAELEDVYKRLTAHPSKKFVETWALHLYASGRRPEAIAELEKIRKDYPKNRTFRTHMVAMYLAEKRAADAQRVLDEALKNNPKDVEALVQRGQIHLMTNNVVNLEKDMNEVLKSKQDSPEAHYLLARVHKMRGNLQNERRELYEALKYGPALLAARLDLAQLLISTGGAKSAIELLEAAPEDQRELMPLLLQKNWGYLASQQNGLYRSGVQKVLAMGRVPEAVFQEGLIALQDKNYARSRTLLEEALQKTPSDTRILQTLAQTYMNEAGGALKAAQALEKYAKADPKNPRIQHLYGSWLTLSGKLDEARTVFDKAYEAEPVYQGTAYAAAQLEIARGRPEEAKKAIRSILQKDSSDPGANVMLGMVEDIGGRKQEAMLAYRRVLEREPNNFIALNNLAYRLTVDDKGIDEALKFAQKAKEVAPDQTSVDDTLGWIYYKKGLYQNAVRHLEAATSQKGAPPVRFYHLAMAYKKAGDSKKAMAVYQEAMRAAPKLPEAEQAKSVLGVQ